MWRLIEANLRHQIESGALAPGDRVPTQDDLAQEYGSSLDPVRKALKALENQGLVTKGGGRRGRFVRANRRLTFYAVRSESRAWVEHRASLGTDAWVTEAAEQGYEAGQEISVEIKAAGPAVAKWLNLEPETVVTIRKRLRTLDGEPHDLNDTYYPRDISAGTAIEQPADVPQGTIALMLEMGHEQVRFADEVTARMPDPDEANRLRIPPGVPVIVQTRTGYTTERPVKTTVTIWPADRVRIVWEFDG